MDNYKLYRLTSADHNIFKKLNIDIELTHVLKSTYESFEDAMKTYGYRFFNIDECSIFLISKQIKLKCNGIYATTGSIHNYYKNAMMLNNLDKYSLIALYKSDKAKNCQIAWDKKFSGEILVQLHSEVTKIYQQIFHIKEICKMYNVCDDVKKYIIKFL